MITVMRCIRSDFYKLKHTPILWLHLIIPFIGAFLFLSYYSFSRWDTANKISGYLEVLAMIFPTLIGLMSGMIIEQEEQAGNFQMFFSSTKYKFITYISKLITLLILGIFSVIIAVGVFAIGFQKFSPIFYIQIAGYLFIGNIFLYILHMLVSLQFGKGASIGLGIAGSLISALMITGLGDRCWKFIPWAFSVRLCDYFLLSQTNAKYYNIATIEINKGLFIIVLGSIFIMAISIFWFQYWEGRKSFD